MSIGASIDVVLAEDQALVRGALAALLGLEVDIRVVAQAADGEEALALVEVHRPHVLVTDIEMPKRTGLELANELRLRNSATRVIIVTTFARSGYCAAPSMPAFAATCSRIGRRASLLLRCARCTRADA